MNREDILPVLKRNAWFAQLPTPLVAKILDISKLKNLQKTQCLHTKNDPGDGLYCVLSGKIRVSNVNAQGREMVLTWLSPGSWFGEISLFDELPRSHDAHAESDCCLLMISKTGFHSLLSQHPEIYPFFIRLLCQRIRATFGLIDETGGLSLKGRLANRLLLLADGLSESDVKRHYEINVSQDALAQMINSSRQTINKLLGELKSEGLVSLDYGKIIVIDRSELSKLGQM